MGGFRAKDADRDRFVELIEAAYVDGQLGSADRDLRIERALTATSLLELEALTRDLQPPPGAAIAHVEAVHATAPATRPSPAPRRLAGVVVALVVVGAFAVGAGSLVMFADDATDSGTATEAPVVVGSASAGEEPAAQEPDAFEMTPAGVRAFLRSYEEQFGTLDAFEASFYPTWAGAEVPVRGARPRYERWTWRGAWVQDTEASAVTGVNEIVDLGAVNVRRLFANIATAKRTLRVPRGDLTHVIVHRWTDQAATVNIYIANTFSESGHLTTTLSGDVVGRYPYSP